MLEQKQNSEQKFERTFILFTASFNAYLKIVCLVKRAHLPLSGSSAHIKSICTFPFNTKSVVRVIKGAFSKS